MNNNRTSRNRQLAKIHALAKELGLPEDARRSIMYCLTGKRSSADMDQPERLKVIDFLQAELEARHTSFQQAYVSDAAALEILGL